MIATQAPLPDVGKIAFLRANGLGDYIFALPALDSLRAAYPHAEIVLLGKSWHESFLVGRPGSVDRVIQVPPSQGVSEQTYWENSAAQNASLEQFFDRMRAESFDLAIQAHGGGRNSNPFVLNLGARHTAGMRTPDAPALDFWMPYRYWQHEVLRLLEVVSLVGAPPVMLEPRLHLKNEDHEEAQRILGESSTPLAILHPSATDARRRWSAHKFAAVGDALADSGMRVVVTGAQAEREVADAVISAMQLPAQNISGELSLNGLAGVMARARLVVGNDSGPLHLAEALGAPTVSIYWCGNLINAGPFTRSRHRQLLSWRLECPRCGANTMVDPCRHSDSFVDDVRVEDVLEEVFSLLQSEQAVGAP